MLEFRYHLRRRHGRLWFNNELPCLIEVQLLQGTFPEIGPAMKFFVYAGEIWSQDENGRTMPVQPMVLERELRRELTIAHTNLRYVVVHDGTDLVFRYNPPVTIQGNNRVTGMKFQTTVPES
jgi:hypothetical protein